MKRSNLRRAAGAIATSLIMSWTPITRGDDLATVFQYELSLGGKQAVSTFYFAHQSDGASRAVAFDTHPESAALRLPIYSTDPGMPTTLSRLSVSLRAAAGEGTTSADMTFVEFLGGLVGLAAYIGLPIYGMVKEFQEVGEIDLSGLQVIPPVTPSAAAAGKQPG